MPDRRSAGRFSGENFDASLVNSESFTMYALLPVCIWSDGTMKRASNASTALSRVAGLTMPDMIDAANAGGVAFHGTIKAATAQWDVVTGMSGGLVPGQDYWLGTDGVLDTSAPSSVGKSVVLIGHAIDEETMELRISRHPILL